MHVPVSRKYYCHNSRKAYSIFYISSPFKQRLFINSTNTTKKQQKEGCILPPIPQDLIQPLRDAIPKIDQALLNSVPEEAIPLCQQLFSAWLSTTTTTKTINKNHQNNILPPRSKSSLNIKPIYQYSPSPSTNRMNDPSPSIIMEQQQKLCKKSQSTSRLSAWLSWSMPNKKKIQL
ncbi:unnamed protein product [Cunninghamella blakesleeana]